jgi:hypothetical protein
VTLLIFVFLRKKISMTDFNINNSAVPATNGSTANDFDLASIALPQNYQDMMDVQTVLTKVSLRKPNKHEWFRIHPSADYRFACLILKFEDEFYFVHPNVAPLLGDDAAPMMLYTAVNSHGAVFLFPVRLPGPDGTLDDFARNYHRICQLATTKWTLMTWNKHTRQHEVKTTDSITLEPEFPVQPFKELVQLAFEGASITDPNHRIIKYLQGIVE